MEPKYRAGSLHKILPEYKGESFRVKHHSANQLDCWRHAIGKRKSEHITPGTYTILHNCQQTIMSDTPMEERTNTFFMQRAKGHVLIGGLGLAWVILNIQENPEVLSITVVELNPEVIAYAKSHGLLNHKVTVIESDCETFCPPPDTKYDVIYMDIWNYTDAENLDQMQRLRDYYKKFLVRKGWFGCWRERDTVRLAQRDKEDYYACLGGSMQSYKG